MNYQEVAYLVGNKSRARSSVVERLIRIQEVPRSIRGESILKFFLNH